MKRIELIATAILTLLAGGTYSSRAQNATLIAQQAYIKASNTGVPTPGEIFGSNQNFGWSVAIAGDTMVIGALWENSSATGVNGNQTNNNARDSGAAYVFVRDGTNWVQQAYLKASNTGANDYFGTSVAISGDTIVVGAFGEDSNATGVNGNQTNNSATDSGAAYVFVREGTNWSQQAYLKASNTGSLDSFGYRVAVFGETVVVGAHNEDSNATGVNGNQGNNSAIDSGAAYVFVRDGTNWSQQAYLKASNTGGSDAFGIAVAVFGDTIAIGAGEEDSNADGINGNQGDNSAPSSGAVYVFVRNGTNWSQQAYLKASNSGGEDDFGYSVALSDNTLVVGAHKEASKATGVNGNQSDNSAFQAGAAYVFVRDWTNWSQQAYLKASNPDGLGPIPDVGDNFGYSVAIFADTVVVGAPGEASNGTGVNGNQSDNSAPIAGAAYVFVRSTTNWSQQAYLKPSNPRTYGEFGISLSVSGDTVVVGADGDFSNATGVNGDQSNTNAPFSGAAYVFTGLGPPAPQPRILNHGFSGGQFSFDLTGPTGRSVVVEASSDLVNWLPVWTNTFGAGALNFSDPQSGISLNRFYRVHVP